MLVCVCRCVCARAPVFVCMCVRMHSSSNRHMVGELPDFVLEYNKAPS